MVIKGRFAERRADDGDPELRALQPESDRAGAARAASWRTTAPATAADVNCVDAGSVDRDRCPLAVVCVSAGSQRRGHISVEQSTEE